MSHGLTGNSSKCSISFEKQKTFISRKALTIESKLINRRRRPGLNEACEVYEVDVSDTGPVSEDEDILNYDDVDDPDAYV